MTLSTDDFLRIAKALADTRRLVLPHPLGGTDEPTLRSWTDAAIDALIAEFG